MTDLKLELNEDIILQSTEVERYGVKEISLDEMVLTNKNIICVYDKSNGLFSKSETIVEKIPLSTVRVANDKVQAFIFDSDDYGMGLQVFFANGQREHFVFYDEKRELQRWEKKLCSVVLEQNGIPNSSGEKNTIAGNDSFEKPETMNKEKTVKFCSYCGTKLDKGARFCKNCGEQINGNSGINVPQEEVEEKPLETNPTERKTVYEGTLHKCPSCGQVLASFNSICPACGHEIRDTKSSSSVRELALKLEKIEARQMPIFEEKHSVMKMVFGRDFKKEDEAEEARDRFEEQKDEEKAELIINYSVPNTKEDILEFMLLASSNINLKKGIDDEVSKAWLQKLDQVYQRAEIIMKNTPEFNQVKSIYDAKKKQIKDKRIKTVIITLSCILGYFSLLGLLWNPIATISILVCILVLIGVLVILFKKR